MERQDYLFFPKEKIKRCNSLLGVDKNTDQHSVYTQRELRCNPPEPLLAQESLETKAGACPAPFIPTELLQEAFTVTPALKF